MRFAVIALFLGVIVQPAFGQTDPTPLSNLTTPRGFDLDPFCLAVASHAQSEFDKLPADKQTEYSTAKDGLRLMDYFYAGAASARRTDDELASEMKKAFSYLASRPVSEQQDAVGKCHSVMQLRMNAVASSFTKK